MRLTRDEIVLVASVLVALVTGVVVMHYREYQRWAHPVSAPAAAVTPHAHTARTKTPAQEPAE